MMLVLATGTSVLGGSYGGAPSSKQDCPCMLLLVDTGFQLADVATYLAPVVNADSAPALDTTVGDIGAPCDCVAFGHTIGESVHCDCKSYGGAPMSSVNDYVCDDDDDPGIVSLQAALVQAEYDFCMADKDVSSAEDGFVDATPTDEAKVVSSPPSIASTIVETDAPLFLAKEIMESNLVPPSIVAAVAPAVHLLCMPVIS